MITIREELIRVLEEEIEFLKSYSPGTDEYTDEDDAFEHYVFELKGDLSVARSWIG